MCYRVPHCIIYACDDCEKPFDHRWQMRYYCHNVPGDLGRPVHVVAHFPCIRGFAHRYSSDCSYEHMVPGTAGQCQDCEAQRLEEEARAEEEAARAVQEEAQAAADAAEAEALAMEEAHESNLAEGSGQVQALLPAGGGVPPAEEDIPQEGQQPHDEVVGDTLHYWDLRRWYGQQVADDWWNQRFGNR